MASVTDAFAIITANFYELRRLRRAKIVIILSSHSYPLIFFRIGTPSIYSAADTKPRTMTVCPARDLEIPSTPSVHECVASLAWGQSKPGTALRDGGDEAGQGGPRGLATPVGDGGCWREFSLPPHQLLVYTVVCRSG